MWYWNFLAGRGLCWVRLPAEPKVGCSAWGVFQVAPLIDFTPTREQRTELTKLEVLTAETTCGPWQRRGAMSARFVTESKLGIFASALILQGKQSRSHPLCPHHRYALLCLWWTWCRFIPKPAEIVRPGLANTNGLTLQQHQSIQNPNLKYGTYIRIISSNKHAPAQAGENDFLWSAGRAGFRAGLWTLVEFELSWISA